MPQTVTFTVAAKFEKGPDLKSEAKVEVGSYTGLLDEALCKCSGPKTFDLPTISKGKIELLIVSASKYKSDKDCMSGNGEDIKRIKWYLEGAESADLIRPQVLSSADKDLSTVTFDNQLTDDVTVSVLAILKKDEHKKKDEAKKDEAKK